MSIRLYVGNLPKEIDRKELQEIFAEAGDSVTTKVITDRKTGKCRGFGFVTVKTDEEADQIIEKYNGFMFKENPIKIEKALPRSKGKGDEESAPQPAAPVTKASGAASGGGGGGERRGGDRRGGGNKSRRGSSAGNTTSTSTQQEASQPDPRWAQELEKLKQMLAAQASNP